MTADLEGSKVLISVGYQDLGLGNDPKAKAIQIGDSDLTFAHPID